MIGWGKKILPQFFLKGGQMKYILKNIILFFKYDKKIFLLCVSSVCVSMLSILIAYGIYSNYMVQKLSSENDLRSLQIDISASEEKHLLKVFLQMPS